MTAEQLAFMVFISVLVTAVLVLSLQRLSKWNAEARNHTGRMFTDTSITSLGIKMPVGFNVSAHSIVRERLSRYLKSHEAQWRSFTSAWNSVALRARATAEYDWEFTRLITISKSPPPEDRLRQEQALFGFFVNALSALECFYYAAYCFASILKPVEFPVSTPKDLKFYPNDVANKFAIIFAGEPISIEMQMCLNSPTYDELMKIRNVLAHRGTLPRQFFIGGEKDGSAMIPSNPTAPSILWSYDFAIDSKTTQERAQWVSKTLSRLLEVAEQFCTAKL